MIELLAPAGDMEKLQIAVAYGADAVYLSGQAFGLRAMAKNFNDTEMAEGIAYAHKHGVKAYVTANIIAHNDDIEDMKGYFEALAQMGADAFIISDPGVFQLARKAAPEVEIHVSTQANITNYASAMFWYEMGAKRIILARELTVGEISKIREKCPEDLRLEGFVHGAMCMAYSGRCLLSRYMTGGRDANLGACAHPCRYSYRLFVEENSRPGQYLPVEESDRGIEIFAAEDLCMIAHLPALIEAGLDSFKIEGRMKTPFYVGLAVRAYRQAIDDIAKSGIELYKSRIPYYLDMLEMASHRTFSTGLYFGWNNETVTSVTAPYYRTHDFVGIVQEYNSQTKLAIIEQRNVFAEGEYLTFVPAKGESFSQQANDLHDEKGIRITRAPHAKQRVVIPVERPVEKLDLVCKACKDVRIKEEVSHTSH